MLYLYFVVGCIAIVVLVLANPTPRNVMTLKIGVLGCIAAVIGGVFFTDQTLMVMFSVFLFVVLWMFGQALLWPFRAFASLFNKD